MRQPDLNGIFPWAAVAVRIFMGASLPHCRQTLRFMSPRRFTILPGKPTCEQSDQQNDKQFHLTWLASNLGMNPPKRVWLQCQRGQCTVSRPRFEFQGSNRHQQRALRSSAVHSRSTSYRSCHLDGSTAQALPPAWTCPYWNAQSALVSLPSIGFSLPIAARRACAGQG
jgi:hypothetical protein